MADLIPVRLFLVRDHYGRAEQAVADSVALAGPSYAVVDDVSVHGAVLTDLTDLDPSVFHEDRQGALDCPTRGLGQGHQCVLADYYGVVGTDPCDKDVHELRRLRSLGDEGPPCLMGGPFRLDPIAPASGRIWKLLHVARPCVAYDRFSVTEAHILTEEASKNYVTRDRKLVTKGAPLRHQL